MRPSVKNFF